MWGADGRSWRRHAPTETSTAHCHRQGRAPWPLRSRQCLQAEPPETQPARSPAAPNTVCVKGKGHATRGSNPRQPEVARVCLILSANTSRLAWPAMPWHYTRRHAELRSTHRLNESLWFCLESLTEAQPTGTAKGCRSIGGNADRQCCYCCFMCACARVRILWIRPLRSREDLQV
jgi:hypothetical protein